MHVGQGRRHPLHVEYIHIGVCLGFIQDVMFEAILSHPRLKMDQKIAVVKALGKILWIQNDLFAKWYVRDGDEFKEEENVVEIEQEGYLHGKKIINNEDDGRDDTTAEGICPFSGLSRGTNDLFVTEQENGHPSSGSDVSDAKPGAHSGSGLPRPVERIRVEDGR